MKLKLIHLSDLHCHDYPLQWHEWTMKRFLASGNLVLQRARKFPVARFQKLVSLVRTMDFDHLLITGDLTSLGLEREFEQARTLLESLLNVPEKVTIIPGNHDRYIGKNTDTDLFQKYFGEFFTVNTIRAIPLNDQWHLVGWDSTHPNDILTAAGTVRRSTILATEQYINRHSAASRYIIMNHYPVWFPDDHHVHDRHELYNLEPVRQWLLKQPQVRLYLHGHVHRNWFHRVARETEPLIVVNSASSTAIPEPFHSSFHEIMIEDNQVQIHPVTFSCG
ncbi:MAG: metallophosphoesterase [SAR324 cluster bacterium]|nr:metallophosphoesterase [SAR324 cluster bacterium]